MVRAPIYRFSTAPAGPEQAFDAWRRQNTLFDLAPSARDIGFGCDFSGSNLDGVLIGRCLMRSSPGAFYRARRDASLLRRDEFDYYYFHLCLAGTVELATEQHCVQARPSQIVIADMTRPSHWTASQGHAAMLMVPRDRLPARARSMHGLRLDAKPYAPVISYLQSIARHRECWPRQGAAWLSRCVVDLLTAHVLNDSRAASGKTHEPPLRQRERVEDYIRAHLGSADLSATRISREVGVSRSALYRMFGEDGGVRHFIQAARLDAIHRALRTPGPCAKPRLGELAWRYGFASASQFSRSYRHRFGHAPREQSVSDAGSASAGAGNGNGLPESSPTDRDYRGWIHSGMDRERRRGE
ncbi:helix-turn-helix domain-containing protein [Lysobacter sp. TAB13]|uniref:helix-turn-helix domain-containing protein n=1 Tax=Lysobacter sp. TAB13 TaxID=3233065 RepID=UPI003F9D9EAE